MGNIVIIGGGVAGLSAGIYARMRGYNAIIVEKHNILGGNLTGWNRNGYHIDNCVHWLVGTNKNDYLYKIWEDIGALGNVDIYQSEAFYTYENGGVRLSASKDIKKFRADLLAIAPEDEKQINWLIKAIKAIQGYYGVGGENHDEKDGVFKMLKSVPIVLKCYNMTIGDLAKKFKNEVIRGFLKCLFTERFSALVILFFLALYMGGDAALPSGGSVAMAQRIGERFLSLGGKMLLGKEVSEICVDKKLAYAVKTKDGVTIPADAVVVACDPKVVFGKMIDIPMPKQLQKMYDDEKLCTFSSTQCAFACEKKDLPFSGEVIFDLSETESIELCAESLFVKEFSYEKSFAPEGSTVLQTMVFFKEDVSEKYIKLRENDREEYKKQKKNIAKTVVSALERYYVGLKDKLKLLDVWTPATYKRYTNSQSGAYMTFGFSKKVAPIRKSNRVKGVKNMVLATQWIQALGGLPIAAECGKIAIKTIEKLKIVKKAVTAKGLRAVTDFNV